jgi:hypothetical protein
MLKKTIEYEDFDGTVRKEDFYFNLTTAEIAEMELSVSGGLVNMINELVQAKDGGKIIALFKEIIQKAYGVKSPDGRRFMKSEELFKAFSETEAYSILFMELATNADRATEFVNGIVPKTISEPPKG